MTSSIDEFLRPLEVDVEKIHRLARSLRDTYLKLAAESTDQFLPTPISESILRPELENNVGGRYLAIDIGGTNLRVGFIELLGSAQSQADTQSLSYRTLNGSDFPDTPRVKRHLETAWPIGEQLKHNKAEDLFRWIGSCIAQVVSAGVAAWPGELPDDLPMGVTFSFPMIQKSLAEAILMPMGKGFAIASNLNLAEQLRLGYENTRNSSLPTIRITAIVNDAVATLVSFAYQHRSTPPTRASMGLICGTGCNATISLPIRKLLPSKRPVEVKVQNDNINDPDLRIAVNTEWSIKGSAEPLHDLGFITEWDSKLDQEGEHAGFMPFEYMTAGRYLGELGRLIFVDYLTKHLSVPPADLPIKLQEKHGLTTSFLGNLGPHLAVQEPSIVKQLEHELPPTSTPTAFKWTSEAAATLLAIAKSIQHRASGMVAAATLALLACADELTFSPSIGTDAPSGSHPQAESVYTQFTPSHRVPMLKVGYTGGCIQHFQDYLDDCQAFLDIVVQLENLYPAGEIPRVVLVPCHDGGIIGAGILAATVQSIARDGSNLAS